jgi:GIY-YIG domain-containing protein
MSWTKPRLIAQRKIWFSDLLDHDGPACYEIGTGGPRGGRIEWHYVGETNNEWRRMSTYGQSGSHLSKLIDWHIREGWSIYYRAISCESKSEAKQTQDNLLRRYEYDWNQRLP